MQKHNKKDSAVAQVWKTGIRITLRGIAISADLIFANTLKFSNCIIKSANK